jgi:hypothetical protein
VIGRHSWQARVERGYVDSSCVSTQNFIDRHARTAARITLVVSKSNGILHNSAEAVLLRNCLEKESVELISSDGSSDDALIKVRRLALAQ